MGKKFKILGGKEYEVDDLSAQAKATIKLIQYTLKRMHELDNMQKLLQCAKNSYIDSIKKEMLTRKSGFLFEDG